jgi:hypothetical protein
VAWRTLGRDRGLIQMPIALTTAQTLTNGTRVVLANRRMYEDEKVFTCDVQMRTAPGGTPQDSIISDQSLEIRGPQGASPGSATVVGKETAPASGSRVSNLLRYYPSISVSQAQWDALVTAYKGSLAALEAHLLAAGYLHSTLAGT